MTDTKTPYGIIHHGGPCKDDYDNINIYHQKGTGDAIKLQGPALRSFREAENKIGKPIVCTGTWRSCRLQRELYSSDSSRFAHPDVTLHTRGLAIDVSTGLSFLRRRRIRGALLARGWHQVRPDDEPWHYSFWLTA